MDIWQYIRWRSIPIPSLYFAHCRDVLLRQGTWLAVSPVVTPLAHEQVVNKLVRFRTIGDMTCTGAVDSCATNLDEIILEIATARETERGTRADDRRSDAAMEERKSQGYF
jgi:sulfate adenylyltransferase subunit 2